MQLSDLKKWTNDLLSGTLKLVPMKRNSKARKEETGEEETGEEELEDDSKGSKKLEKEESKENRNDKYNENVDQTSNGKERSEL